MLSFINTMFLDMLHEDGLLITAKGLGAEEVILNLIRVYSDPGNLVLVMGLSDEEENFYQSKVDALGEAKVTPRKVTSEYSSNEREKLYLQGGVLFVTNRILVVDMLTEKLPIHLITGIIIAKAHRTAESCQESFVLRMYRQKNTKGFIKAFSSSPLSFTAGFCQIERVMRGLFLRNLYLWPRFHNEIVSAFKHLETEPIVCEIHVQMTQHMRTIQTALLDLINFSVQELKRLNPSLYVDDEGEGFLVVENAIAKSFYKLLQRELEPIWHQLSSKTKQLVADMKTLHNILVHLTRYDAITFHTLVSALRTTENAMRTSGWMILDAAETLFVTANARVFGLDDDDSDNIKRRKRLLNPSQEENIEVKCEENPKWQALTEVINEIKNEVKKNGVSKDAFPSEKCLILTSDERESQQLQDVVTIGAKSVLARMFNRALGEKHGYLNEGQSDPEKPKRFRHIKDKGIGKKSKPVEPPIEEKPGLRSLESPVIIIQSMAIGHFKLSRLINDMKPRFIVLYDVEVGVIRLLETFQAANQDFQLKTYLLMYKNSAEEQAYLTSLRKEKEAFEKLIKEKSTMVIPEDRDGRLGVNPDLQTSKKVEESSRKAGEVKSSDKVIVDMREFRSELPPLLHKRGIEIEPITLEVGDYILTPEICVERKSISDLIGSLNSGRLYNQATSMTRFYTKPMLLIEFDSNKPFALQGKYYLSRDVAASDLTSRLQLLTMHFPKLRILWSPSPHATAELFEELKKGREQPDASKAASVSIDVIDDYNNEKFNPVIYDFLKKLPGVNSKNIYFILNSVDSLGELLDMNLDDLSNVLNDKGAAEILHKSLHENVYPLEDSKNKKDVDAPKGPLRSKGSRFKSNVWSKKSKKAEVHC